MSNRASYMQAITAGDGMAGAGDVLPPGNSGHVNVPELAASQAGRGPEGLTDQLELYANYDYKPHPHAPEEVAAVAVKSRMIRATTPSITGPVEPVRDLPADGLSPLLELQTASEPDGVTDAVSETTDEVTGTLEAASETDPTETGRGTDGTGSGLDGLTDTEPLGGLLDR